jgi:hypothetical protein
MWLAANHKSNPIFLVNLNKLGPRLFLHYLITILRFANSYPQSSPYAICQCSTIGASKDKCGRIEKVGISGALFEPKMVEQWQ